MNTRKQTDVADQDGTEPLSRKVVTEIDRRTTTQERPANHLPRGLRAAGLMFAGPILAVLLLVGPVAGAEEHAVVACLLICTGLSWGLLAIGGGRPWAAIPATVLLTCGLVVLVTGPGSKAMDALAWFWPPVLAYLAVWILLKERRDTSPRRPGRRLVLAAGAGLALVAVGGAYQTVGTALDAFTYRPPGRLIDVGGHRLHILCTGSGRPTVILETLAGGVSPMWGWVQPEVAQHTRVCSYDRAGLGWSDPVDAPQDGVAVARDLTTLLQRAGETGPYVMVGHSLGGLYTRLLAHRDPAQVAAMVLLDARHPDEFARAPETAQQYRAYRDVQSTFPVLARIGLWRLYFDLGGHFDFGGLPDHARAQTQAAWSTAALHRGQREEAVAVSAVDAQVRALGTLGDLPLAVLTAGNSTSSWRALQEDLTRLSTHVVHRTIDGADHTSLVTDQRAAHEVAVSIRALVDGTRAEAAAAAG
jgi:pimeloyl-ACP methyl ester carboxylesterase